MAKKYATQKYSIFFPFLLLLVGLVGGIVIGYGLGKEHGYDASFKDIKRMDGYGEVLKKEMGCGALTITSPQKKEKVTSPFTVTAVVDNTDPKCHWAVFEAQAGSIEVTDKQGQTVGNGILTTTDDWMTEQPVTYSGEISFTQTPQNGSLQLVIKEEDPSGQSAQQITYPLRY